MRVDNAIIMAAGTASRFAPISYEKPKALIKVRGEVLIERQIRQLKEAGINEIIIVTGYKAEQFEYLKDKFGVTLVYNSEFLTRNNNGSIFVAREYLKNSYICSSDNYFLHNPFERNVEEAYYSCVYVNGKTNEWCVTDENGWIKNVKIGGNNSWIMLGHVFWSEAFSKKFLSILKEEYGKLETVNKLWESIYIENIKELPLKIRKYPKNYIFEFDTLDELREFDNTYCNETGSHILQKCAKDLGIEEKDIIEIKAFKDRNNVAVGFTFYAGKRYKYYYETQRMEREK